MRRVEKPARYLGNEWGATRKAWDDVTVRLALAFPDLYEVGMSHLGSKILYQLLNRRADALCERVFAPAPDMERAMREAGFPLFGLESLRPLTEFDGIGFSLSYELTYTNILNMLALAGIPVERQDRETGDWPLVFAGGPNSFNPEPFADFVDFVVVGDGEDVVHDLVDAFHSFKTHGTPRQEALKALTRISGVYVPQFYGVEYLGPNQPIARFVPDPDVSLPVRKRTVQELQNDFHPTETPVPYVPIVHDRVPTEVRRGCDAGCRYCQAGFIYLPVRERKAEDVVSLTSQTIRCTGYEEYSLFSLSSGDYTQSREVVQPLTMANSPLGASMSLPSLRVDSFSLEMATAAQHIRKSTFTFAPEAGSQRMRDIINKNISEEEIRYAIRETYRAGWQALKLYLMIGLPGETHEDVTAIVDLIDKIKRDCDELRRADSRPRPPIRINLTVSTFVPKPHVPFQWRAQDDLDQITAKQQYLFAEMRKRGVKVSAHDKHTSELEAVLSRGDRRLCRLVKRAWELGAAHDAWSEHHRPELWARAAQEVGVDFGFYAHTRWEYDWTLPWDAIDSGITKRHLVRDDKLADELYQNDHCSKKCWGCGVCFRLDVHHDLAGKALDKIDCSAPPRQPDFEIADNHPPREKVQRLRARFTKLGDVRWISHLDVMRLFERALRRAALPVTFSRGFNPRPSVEFAAPLALGITSEAELVDVYLGEALDPADYAARLNAALPPEVQLTAAWEVPVKGPSAMALVEAASYRVVLAEPVPAAAWDAFLARQEIPYVKTAKTGTRTVDLRPLILAVRPEDAVSIRLELKTGSRGNGKPEDVIGALGEFLETDIDVANIHRLGVDLAEAGTEAAAKSARRDLEAETTQAAHAHLETFEHLMVY
ncbi:MAG: TIGR03960 family B12-binding radical SAM protein [Candidatus Sericytochromatia bacterium]|nr:TIGR03960 family B12-binding radical SAM protein [Candidatus Tanganyikabacteria bacterium]